MRLVLAVAFACLLAGCGDSAKPSNPTMNPADVNPKIQPAGATGSATPATTGEK